MWSSCSSTRRCCGSSRPVGQCPLITEALRGAGAVLVDAAGRPVMAGRHPLGDLAPRDVVSSAMQQRMAAATGQMITSGWTPPRWAEPHWSEISPRWPRCAGRAGIDPAAEPIPVAPGAHYACGGIRADMDGRTSVTGLYAVGEAASTGVHGANRLASNSLTEALITGRRAGELLGQDLPGPAGTPRLPPAGAGGGPAVRPALAGAMSGTRGDCATTQDLEQAPGRPSAAGPARRTGRPDLATVEATNLHAVSILVTAAALARAESRGCHRWRDAPPAIVRRTGAPYGRARGGGPAAGGRGSPGRSGGQRLDTRRDGRPDDCSPLAWIPRTPSGSSATRSMRTCGTDLT